MSLLFYDPADKNETSAARGKLRAKRFARAAKNHFSLGEVVILSVLAAEKNSPFSTLRDSRRLKRLDNTRLSRLYFGLELKTHQRKKRHPSQPHESEEAMNSNLRSESAREVQSAKSRRGGEGRKKSLCSAETPLTVKRTQTKRQNLKHRILNHLVS